jgi:hypothetical protein
VGFDQPEQRMGSVILVRDSLEKARESRSKLEPGVTCVAFFHERRPSGFDALVDRFHDSLRSQLSYWLKHDWVRLTPPSQIHCSLIGLEAHATRAGLFNRNMFEIQNGARGRPMDLEGFCAYLRQLDLPIPLRFGGFAPEARNLFDARPPFERSFTIRPDGLLVAVGWPISGGVIEPKLFDFRKGAEAFQILHKYHRQETDCDNDAFCVLGSITLRPWSDERTSANRREQFLVALSEAQEKIRGALQSTSFGVVLSREHCSIVKYRSADLADVDESDVLSLNAITAERLRALYRSERRT